MSEKPKLLKQGAEAKLFICSYLGRPTVIKERFKKNYRHPELDFLITKERIKNEARAILRCKTANIKTPSLYLVDFQRRRIYMQYFEDSITVKDFIINIVTKQETSSENSINSLDALAKIIGATVRKLHDNNLIHGDLTTSNMLLIPQKEREMDDTKKWLEIDNTELVIIDFGLSSSDCSAEDKAVDLYVLERALISTHNDYPDLFKTILEGYKDYNKKSIKDILSKFEEVRARGRKRTMVG